MRTLAALLLFLGASPALAEGCKVESGADYRFEKTYAVRAVDDAHDRGSIRLATFIYRPLRADRNQVVLFSHGSTNGQTIDPREPTQVVPCSLKNYFLSRGYTLVAAMRRGRGESTGTFVEECARNTDPRCTPRANREASDAALAQALADSKAVLDQIVFGKLTKPGEQVILAGHSRGGLLSLALAAERPRRTAAVINFSGGWLGFQAPLARGEEGRLRQEWHGDRLRRFGKGFSGPTLWLYAPEDPLLGEAVTRQFHAEYRAGGGVADYRALSGPSLENGHLLYQESPLWAAAVDAFLSVAQPGKVAAR